MRLVRLTLPFLFALLFAGAARAQSVHWEVSDDPGELLLSFENCSTDTVPTLPAVDGVQFNYSGSSESSQISFGTGGNSSRRTVSLHFRLRARAGSFTIPEFEVKTDKGPMRVAAFTGGGNRNSGLDNAVSSRLMPATASVWAGEVFPITYTLDVVRRNFSQLSPSIEWNPAPLITEEWSKPEAGEVVVNGEPRFNIVYKARAIAKAPGVLTLNSTSQLVNLQTGSIGFGIFQTPRVEQVNVESNHPRLTIKALPPAPPGFGGAVGDFKLVSKIVPETAAVGEPVTWTLELSGTGNWPDIAGLPSREVSNDFQVVQPKAKRTPAEGKLFDVTLAEDVVLVPTKAGTYNLGPIAFTYFDPKSGTYKTITAARTSVTITAPNAPKLFTPPAAASEAPTAPANTELEAAKLESLKSKTPAPPAGIPRDPLPGSKIAPVPLAKRTLLAFVLAPFALPLLVWAWLALRRAQRTDPARARREAHARLRATLAQLRTKPSPQLLLAWQRDAAVLWQVAHAAPPATALPEKEWSALWLESDRALYGVNSDLPADWIARAEAALAAKHVAGFNPLRLFLPRNLLPFAALLLLALVPVTILRAVVVDGAAAYRTGDFAAAEKAWRTTLEKNPTDAFVRHNLSLALAQQERFGEAAAHAAAALVQFPSEKAIAWQFALASEKAGAAPAPLAGFIVPGPAQSLAMRLAPSEWQLALIGAAALAAVALSWLLVNFYGRRSRGATWTAGALFTVAVLLAAASLVSIHEFGETADARAVIVWRAGVLRSIPTEADTTQKTTALSAGSVAIADKTFLNDRWVRLVFGNGQTGWVRRDELVAVWR
jgi:hypothetical protein